MFYQVSLIFCRMYLDQKKRINSVLRYITLVSFCSGVTICDTHFADSLLVSMVSVCWTVTCHPEPCDEWHPLVRLSHWIAVAGPNISEWSSYIIWYITFCVNSKIPLNWDVPTVFEVILGGHVLHSWNLNSSLLWVNAYLAMFNRFNMTGI